MLRVLSNIYMYIYYTMRHMNSLYNSYMYNLWMSILSLLANCWWRIYLQYPNTNVYTCECQSNYGKRTDGVDGQYYRSYIYMCEQLLILNKSNLVGSIWILMTTYLAWATYVVIRVDLQHTKSTKYIEHRSIEFPIHAWIYEPTLWPLDSWCYIGHR